MHATFVLMIQDPNGEIHSLIYRREMLKFVNRFKSKRKITKTT